MRCPYCQHNGDRVLDSRTNKEGNSIRRRRQCLSCGRRYTTHETIEFDNPVVIKKDGRREPFNRQKLLNGIRTACKKLPVSVEEIEVIADHVENEARSFLKTEIPSQRIGELVMDALYRLNHVAYVRFSSVYREFKDANQFMKELTEVMKLKAEKRKKKS
jgi:transcriptional repressor NrdR